MINQNLVKQAFLIHVPANNSLPGYCDELLIDEVTKSWLINCAAIEFLEGKIDEETFLDIVDACGQNVNDYVESVNENLVGILNV